MMLSMQFTHVANYGGITNFETVNEIQDGRFSVLNSKIPIELAYESAQSDTTVVCFHGAVTGKVSLPWHVGHGVLQGANANWLAVSDPTLSLHNRLNLGWFAGNSQMRDLQGIIKRTIKHVASITGTKHIIFFGGSGGGFAALDMSRRFPGSLALPMNPQTSIQKYLPGAVERYLELAWPTTSDYSALPRFVKHDQTYEYGLGFENTVAYVQNTRDNLHFNSHMMPFLQATEDRGNVWTFLDGWVDPSMDSGHVPPPKDQISSMLRSLSACHGEWDSALATLRFARPVVRA